MSASSPNCTNPRKIQEIQVCDGEQASPERSSGTLAASIRKQMAEKREKSVGGGMTVQEAGRRGGAKVAAERGSKFYSEIGRKGGEAVSQNREHMANIGRKGGERRGKASRETEPLPATDETETKNATEEVDVEDERDRARSEKNTQENQAEAEPA